MISNEVSNFSNTITKLSIIDISLFVPFNKFGHHSAIYCNYSKRQPSRKKERVQQILQSMQKLNSISYHVIRKMKPPI